MLTFWVIEYLDLIGDIASCFVARCVGFSPDALALQELKEAFGYCVIAAAKSARVRKIIYTSIQGPDEGTAFSPVVQSNRQTEADVRASGLNWVIGRNNKVAGKIDSVRNFPEIRATAVNLTLNDGWKGHDAGQFAFVTFDRKEGKHPFTIASAWDPKTREIMFITKALGDYTDFLPETVHAGGEAIVEGPYGRFTFDDARERQIWVGGGIGITPFVARMKQLAQTPSDKAISLIHSTRDLSEDAMELLKADASAAGVDLHVLVDDTDGFLTADRLREMIPDWKSASVWFSGPAAFGQTLRDDLVKHGLASTDFHQELFNIR